MSKAELIAESLHRAAGGSSLANYPAIFAGFMSRGIAESDIRPRENVFTYNAWRALGRQVRRGEHGVKVCTFVTTAGKVDEVTGKVLKRGGTFARSTTVFHISQTDPIRDDLATLPADSAWSILDNVGADGVVRCSV